MSSTHLKYYLKDGSLKELLPGLIPIGETPKIMSGLITQVWLWCTYPLYELC
jgi:hypothetical protein